ncbi:MEKHLA domain-containing protein [Methylomonas sp. MK1]|uniref:MEKHLA domain-containing protein n=1 Tax=Methylomonas sp. MK1 TaxID=1131552 RepID=UPI00037891A6|nr:MEKHLA domain-containing protein [Methylomonas sp. MK1]
MLDLPVPSRENDFYETHIQLLVDSYRRLLGRPLLEESSALSLGQQAYQADFVLLSHNTAADPLFNYANRTAQDLFELPWPEFIGMPSRFSAEPVNREERERLLNQVASQGYIDNYSGVRIAKSGKRFLIERAVVWNVYDSEQRYVGQAACFSDWRLLP